MGLFLRNNFRSSILLTKSESLKMQNNDGEIVDLYIPRKCSSSGAIIGAKDHASVQIAIVDVDESGRALTTSKMYTVCGEIRRLIEPFGYPRWNYSKDLQQMKKKPINQLR